MHCLGAASGACSFVILFRDAFHLITDGRMPLPSWRGDRVKKMWCKAVTVLWKFRKQQNPVCSFFPELWKKVCFFFFLVFIIEVSLWAPFQFLKQGSCTTYGPYVLQVCHCMTVHFGFACSMFCTQLLQLIFSSVLRSLLQRRLTVLQIMRPNYLSSF